MESQRVRHNSVTKQQQQQQQQQNYLRKCSNNSLGRFLILTSICGKHDAIVYN